MFTNEDKKKVERCKREFFPDGDIPEYLWNERKVIAGSNYTKQEIWMKH